MSDAMSAADPAFPVSNNIMYQPAPIGFDGEPELLKPRDTKRVMQLLDEIKALFELKERDYADQVPLRNIKACRELGIPAWMGVLVRLCDKDARIINLARRKLTGGGGPAVQNESIVDTLKDKAICSLIAIAMLEQEDEDPAYGS